MTDTTATKTEQKKWPIWIMAILAFITIGCGIVTICAPSIFRKFMDIILGIFLFFSGLSWIINAFTNEQKYVGCLVSLGVLVMILGVLLIFSSSEFIGMLTIRCFAIWALLRGCILIYYSITNKEEQKFWRGILTLGILLIILFFVIAFSDKSDAKTVAGICIGISTVFDGLCLLILSFRANDDPSLQDKILQQANQNEIAQGNSPEAAQTVATAQPTVTTPTDNQTQQSNEVQPGATQQPIATATPVIQQPAPEVQAPVQQPVPEVQAPVQQPATEVQAPVEQPTTEVQAPVQQPATEVQAPVEQPATEVQAPVQQPATEVQAPVQQPATEVQAPVQQPATEVQTPVEQPTPEIQAPVEQPTTEAQAPVEQPTTEAQAPVEQPTPEAQAPVEQPTTEAQTPVEQPTTEAQAPVEQPTTEAQQPNNGTPA